MFKPLRLLLRHIRAKELRLRRGDCPVCDRRTGFLKLDATEWAIICLRCRANVVSTGIIAC